MKLFFLAMVYTSGGERAAAPTDADLAARHLAGDPEAFAELVRRYAAAIHHLLYRWTLDRGEAENLTQETFVRLWSALPRLKLDRPLKPYVFKVALNLARNWAAATRKEATTFAGVEADVVETPEEVDLLAHLTDAELAARVRAAVDRLPPLYRTVIALRYTEELSYEELAQVLDLPLNTVRTYLHRAKARLKELLQDG